MIPKCYQYVYCIKKNNKIYINISTDIISLINTLYKFNIYNEYDIIKDFKLSYNTIKYIKIDICDLLNDITDMDYIEVKFINDDEDEEYEDNKNIIKESKNINIYFFGNGNKILSDIKDRYIIDYINKLRNVRYINKILKYKIHQLYKGIHNNIYDIDISNDDLYDLRIFIYIMLDKFKKMFKGKYHSVIYPTNNYLIENILKNIYIESFESKFECISYIDNLILKYNNPKIYYTYLNIPNYSLDPFDHEYIQILLLDKNEKIICEILFLYNNIIERHIKEYYMKLISKKYINYLE